MWRLVEEQPKGYVQLVGPEVEIGWTIGRAWWGRGYAVEAAGAWLHAGFTALGLGEILATVLPENAPSHRVAQRLGMRRLPGLRVVWGGPHVIYCATNPAAP